MANRREVIYKGKVYATLKQLADEIGVSANALRKRYTRGNAEFDYVKRANVGLYVQRQEAVRDVLRAAKMINNDYLENAIDRLLTIDNELLGKRK